MRWKTQEASIPLTVNVTWADGFVNMTSLGQTISCHHIQISVSRLFILIYLSEFTSQLLIHTILCSSCQFVCILFHYHTKLN